MGRFTDSALNDAVRQMYAKANRVIAGTVYFHFLMSVCLAAVYDTWVLSMTVAGLATLAFLICVRTMPNSFFTRCVVGVVLQTFVALHIYELHGMAEMHFFYFTSFVMMIVYLDPWCMWPGAVLIIAQHIIFAVLHNSGINLNFFESDYVSVLKLVFHFGIALGHVGICSYWCVILRDRALQDSDTNRALELGTHLIARSRQVTEAASRIRTFYFRDGQNVDGGMKVTLEEFMKITGAVGGALVRIQRGPTGLQAVPQTMVGNWSLSAGPLSPELEAGLSAGLAERFDRPEAAARPAWPAVWKGGDEAIWMIPIQRDRTLLALLWLAGAGRSAPAVAETDLQPLVESVADLLSIHEAQVENDHRRKEMQHQARLAAIGALAAGVAHEINNPLAIMIASIGQVDEELDRLKVRDVTVQELLARHGEAGWRIRDVVNGLRVFARADKGEPEVFCINDSVANAISLVREIFAKSGITLTSDLGETRLFCRGEFGRLAQVIMNLLSNARDALEGLEGARIDVTLRGVNSRAVLAVRDNGPGVPVELREKIFDPFFTTKVVGKGTGMGLSISTSIVKDMLGNLRLVENNGLGALFEMDLPLDVANLTTVGDRVKRVELGECRDLTVLLADDEVDLRKGLAGILRRKKLEVFEAGDGDEALRMLKEHANIDVVVCDIQMPKLSGLGVVRKLKELNLNPLTILITGGIPKDEDLAFCKAHFTHLLAKPFHIAELMPLLEAARKRKAAGGLKAV